MYVCVCACVEVCVYVIIIIIVIIVVVITIIVIVVAAAAAAVVVVYYASVRPCMSMYANPWFSVPLPSVYVMIQCLFNICCSACLIMSAHLLLKCTTHAATHPLS